MRKAPDIIAIDYGRRVTLDIPKTRTVVGRLITCGRQAAAAGPAPCISGMHPRSPHRLQPSVITASSPSQHQLIH